MPEFSIRAMKRRDIPAVAALESVIYPTPWSPRVFFDELAMGNRSYLVVEDDASIMGYGGLLMVEDDAHITTLAVAPEMRGKRLGVKLMLALVDEALTHGARHLTLEVRVSNTPAQGLYERFGFDPVGRRKDYYVDEDALVMWATDVDTPEYADRIAEIRDSLEGEAP
ncbi:MAG: ribosomal protein S18-alanine N-acetyltransferase [Acidimicrobiia bacterium]|nr:ribosomal protein S18-alanine N-acetyltransferase [Acidimicrobiia bacterium]